MALQTVIRQLVDSYFTVLIAIAGLLAIASACRYYFVIWIGERIVADLRNDVFANVTRLSPEFFDKSHSGEIVSRLTADTTQIKSAVGATASVALRNVILGLGALMMMIYTSPRLSLIVIAAIPLIVLPIVGFGRKVRQRSRAAQDSLADATAYASESISAVRTMQAFTNGSHVRSRFSGAVDFAFDAARLAVRTRALLTGFAIFLIFASIVAVLWIGANDLWGELSQAAGSAERLIELLGTQSAITSPANPATLAKPAKGEIAFEKVSFNYPTRPEQPTLEGLSMAIKPGETVAIVGPSGAGKSTIFALLLRFYDPESGEIKLDNIDIKNLAEDDFRSQIALVPQDTMIFASSAADNISYGKPNTSKENVISAAKAANAHDFIEKMPEGYETILGERGVTLSGGQRQRLAIARAILKDCTGTTSGRSHKRTGCRKRKTGSRRA
ncbi:ABC transporter B family member 1 [Nymphon striatum]|nr:ABC transporter B family member 1 [Nymphon striatum]